MGRALGGVGRESKSATQVLIAVLVEILTIVFEPEFKSMLALDPGQVIDHLSGVVLDLVGVVSIVAEGAETVSVETSAGHAPLDRRAGVQIRNAQRGHGVRGERAGRANRVEKARVTETRFVHEIG